MRYPVRVAIDKFNDLLGLNEKPYMQDWEIECADPNRVLEFIKCYDQNAETDDEKFTLMALILGSYEEYHSLNGPGNEEWGAIKARLETDLRIHCDHILYYGRPETEDEEEWFPITSQMRELLFKCGNAQQRHAPDWQDRGDKASQMIKRAILRHILPVGLSAMCVFALWVIGTLPMIAVFLIDGDFVISEYVQFLTYAIGVSSGLSLAVLLPLALLGEVLAKKNKHAVWIFPLFLCSYTVTLLIIRSILLKSFLDAILSWSGRIALISVLFVLYWAVLWAEKAALQYWWKFRGQRRG